jgi:hypothetical protein
MCVLVTNFHKSNIAVVLERACFVSCIDPCAEQRTDAFEKGMFTVKRTVSPGNAVL